MSQQYPQWIDEYAKSAHNAFRKMVPVSWGPIDGISIFASLNGTFLSKVYKALQKIKQKDYPIHKVAKTFSCPSTMLVAFFFIVCEYQNSQRKNKNKFREIVEYIVEMLTYLRKKDVFVYKSNIVHLSYQIEKLLNETNWATGTRESAREIGKLYNSLFSLVFSLYTDFFPQESLETYGPYDASKRFGNNTIFLIKHFPKIKPIDLWAKIKRLKYSDVKIFQVYKNVKFKCEFAGFHSIYEGDLIKNLIAYSIIVDGKIQNDLQAIKRLSDYFAEVATDQSLAYDSLSKKELKLKVLEWECYQFVDFFRLADMDWKPTEEMWNAVRDRDVPDRFELETFPSFEEYTTSPEYEIYWLKDLYK